MKYAIVKDGIVINVIEYAEQPTTPPPGFDDGHEAIEAEYVSPSWVYADGTFTNPNPPVIVDIPAILPPTPEELMAQLNAIQAQIAALQGTK